MPKVFFSQEPLKREGDEVICRIPLAPARAFGEIVYLTSWSELKDSRGRDLTAEEMSRLYWQMRDLMKGATSEDYIVPIGNPGLIALAALAMCAETDGAVRILDWDNRLQRYRVMDVDTNAQPPLARPRRAS